MILAEIITIGDELLIGQVVNTNASWIAEKLNHQGLTIKQISTIPDHSEDILNALITASNRAQIILITGGLGPTKDDITKKTLASYFKVGLRKDPEALKNVERIFKKYNLPLLQANMHQADVLENAIVLQNTNGTAPGMWITKNEKIFISLPGVPFEMMDLIEKEVIPRLKKTLNLPSIFHQTILTAGIGESFLAEKIADIENNLPQHIKLAYLPKLGQVRLRLSGQGKDKTSIQDEVETFGQKIIDKIKPYVVATTDIPIEKIILDIMLNKKQTLAIAESCTGGYLSHLITKHPGCSAVFLGSVVSYSCELKKTMLGVQETTLKQHGAVSEETVREMAFGVLKNYHSDYAIAISGIAGPDGGSTNKPVGTVWIAVANKKNIKTHLFEFGHQRIQNIERAAVAAFTLLFKMLQTDSNLSI